MKPGYKTISFWLAFLVTILGAAGASGAVPEVGILPQGLTILVMALGAAGYASVRAWVKGADGKPAYKTTEFWLALASVVVGGLSVGGFFPEASVGAKVVSGAAMLLAALGYAVPRSFGQRTT